MQPGAPAPDADAVSVPAEDPVFPQDAGAATQNMNAVVDDNATQAIPPVDDDFGGLPMFRDETRKGGATYERTAEIDLSGMDVDGDTPSRERGRRRGGTNGRNKQGILLGAGFVALLLIGGGGAFLIASNSGSDGSDTGSTGGEAAAPEAPVALETGALFPEDIEIEGVKFERVITDDTGDKCETATHGGYGDVLKDNDCQQLIRATYVDADATRAITTGVAALPSPDNATAAQEAQDLGATTWFAGLKGKDDTGTERMGFAGGHASGAQWGPYLVFTLAANSDGRAPEGDDSDLADLSDGFTSNSLESLAENVD
ncbi:hypothetical protein CDO52_25065 [Nocardiopsis gilva YIM 90087]|uniref:Uncharacterized protein n=1 Tax=Nocardiopsis gilva YIM 90087 TaxID=1235441 RepID=A0A223SEA6_9ACTN|nr:hypothetical protein CDO52_25065 [Nocardiopsis gilva YIM 90087]